MAGPPAPGQLPWRPLYSLPATPACARIERIDGRADDLIVRPNGQMIHAMVLLFRLHTVPGLAQVQLIQEALQRFSVRVVAAQGADWARVRDGLDALLRDVLGPDITVTMERVDAIPREPGGKIKTVISRCQR